MVAMGRRFSRGLSLLEFVVTDNVSDGGILLNLDGNGIGRELFKTIHT